MPIPLIFLGSYLSLYLSPRFPVPYSVVTLVTLVNSISGNCLRLELCAKILPMVHCQLRNNDQGTRRKRNKAPFGKESSLNSALAHYRSEVLKHYTRDAVAGDAG